MAVSPTDICGTIGGGVMEFKLVEKAKDMVTSSYPTHILLQQQFHDKEHTRNQSGMICSGSQLIAFVPITNLDLPLVADILAQQHLPNSGSLQLQPSGISLSPSSHPSHFTYENDGHWQYVEPVFQMPVIHIVGAGHVGLALSEMMRFLGFYIKIYDDRPELNTLHQNQFAHEKIVVDYANIHRHLETKAQDYVVIMTIGYRTDKLVLQQLLPVSCFYLGMLGSEKKVQTLLQALQQEGYSAEMLGKIFAPIGKSIFSKTTQEIAVSIAAQIIEEKNRHLPTGRTS